MTTRAPRAPAPPAARTPRASAPRGGRTEAGAAARPAAEERMLHRRRRTAFLVLLLAGTTLVVVDAARGRPEMLTSAAPAAPSSAPATSASAPAPTTAAPSPSLSPSPLASPSPVLPTSARPAPTRTQSPSPLASRQVAAVQYPELGQGSFTEVGTAGRALGTAGTLRRFRVAVENGTRQNPAAFAAEVDAILGDSRSWVAAKRFRLQRVPKGAAAEFTIYLATPATSERMCALGGLDTERYTSCRLPGQVIINLARWLTAVPDYGAPVSTYRAYMINHEVGHQLGQGHEACPAPGSPAPVMQQQTLGLKGCLAYAWPYLAGRRYTGPAVP
ncbi:DUF3152 domain-containing protein [Phytohabitans houttuyneae]|uniref:DUF3152 domain-containing protein n=1 Tax=Phytohabitans houttuyneae TaxID=1076126 RepID=A0A6V8KA93_9ACTN|nr:DUF3152 domain-containing protein [Phytohabitans houttuyneae]GFJ79069.1 hypothetical protein Phou_032490 [Phytohabitans houttuyneae]